MTDRLIDGGGNFLIDGAGNFLVWRITGVDANTGRISLVAVVPSIAMTHMSPTLRMDIASPSITLTISED